MIFCVEDDESIRELILYTLQSTGFEASGFSCSKSFFDTLEHKLPSLVLLDIMLPGDDGLVILRKLRSSNRTAGIPVIMITAKSAEIDRVIGLDLGADDYISKPFGMMELISRIKAVLRRSEPGSGESVISFKGIKLDHDKHKITIDGTETDFSLKEYLLLQILMENIGIALTRDVILERIWGYEFDGETRTVDVHMRKIRKKLGQYGESIETVRGIGYRLSENSHA